MLIPIQQLFQTYDLKITGILHIGAHECEELRDYMSVGVNPNKILWLDALQEKVDKNKSRNIPNCFQIVVHSTDDKEVVFNITNNYESSSILELKEHLVQHPHIHVIEKRKLITKRIDTFYKENNIPNDLANFINLDIQGNELEAIKGIGDDILNNVKYIYSEVNTQSLYDGCCLLGELDDYLKQKGFLRVDTKMTKHGWGDAFYVRN